jgi:hypothetical protein
MSLLRRWRELHRFRQPSLAESLRRILQLLAPDELLSVELFDTVLNAQVLAEDSRIEYNT